MRVTKRLRDLLLHQVDGRRDDVARRLVAGLGDVFAEIGLDRCDAVRLEMVVDAHLLADHRLALGDGPGAELAADRQHGRVRFGGVAAPVHLAAIGDHALLEFLEIEIEIRQRMLFDRHRFVAQFLPFRQLRHHMGAALGEAAAQVQHRLLQLRVAERVARIGLEGVAGYLHDASPGSPMAGPVTPASTSATWRTLVLSPSRSSLPAMLSRQPMSPAMTVSAPAARMLSAFSPTILSEMSPYLIANVPPKPQHTSGSRISVTVRPATLASSWRGCALTPSSRRPEQAS